MSDERFSEKQIFTEDEKKIFNDKQIEIGKEKVKRLAYHISFGPEYWVVTFNTRFGHVSCRFYTNGNWESMSGKVKGKGVRSMVRYFKPFKVDRSGN